jgi:hypothetical protein
MIATKTLITKIVGNTPLAYALDPLCKLGIIDVAIP